MADLVTLTIDGVSLSVPKGTLIVDAAKRIDNDIPVFCYHPKLKPVGMCRMCLVEIGRPQRDRATGQAVLDEQGKPKIAFGPKLETACTTPVEPGMVVVGASPKVKEARDDILESVQHGEWQLHGQGDVSRAEIHGPEQSSAPVRAVHRGQPDGHRSDDARVLRRLRQR